MTPVPDAKIAEWEQAVRKLTAVKDNKILEAAAARKETRKAAAAKVQSMLAQTGRTLLDDKDTDEAARKKREETFLHGVSERVEQASNTTFIAEDVASKVASGSRRRGAGQKLQRPGALMSGGIQECEPRVQMHLVTVKAVTMRPGEPGKLDGWSLN